jgi:thiol:disulfide interchange protein DsbD
MKFQKFVFFSLLVLCLSTTAWAQASGSTVNIRPQQAEYKVKRGSAVQAAVVLSINHGYHINSNRPTEKFLIPTAFKLEPVSGLRASAVGFPKAKLQKFQFSQKPLSVYEGEVILRFTVRALPTLAPGSYTLKGKLTVQACNDTACLRPSTVEVNIPVQVT